MSTKVVTGTVRLSFPALFEAVSFEDGPAKYSVMLLIPKSEKTTIKKIRDAEEQAKKNGVSSKWGGKTPKEVKSIIKDGDETADEFPERKDMWVMTVRSDRRPQVVDSKLNPIMDPSEIYSGVYGRVSINAYPYKYMGNTGVSFGLNNVQKVADGESLGGAARAEEDFTVLDDDDDESLI